MRRIKLTLAYDGSAYAGWQLQAKNPPPPTIQGELEKVLERIVGHRIPIQGSGRTDAGVHAEGQVCHFDCPEERLDLDWQRVFNSCLHGHIKIIKAERVASSFDSQRDALSKIYAYSLWSAYEKPAPRIAPYCWHTPPLKEEKLLQCAELIRGRRDFSVFQNTGTEIKNTVREINEFYREKHLAAGFDCPENWPVSTWFIKGDGFLRHMIRNIMGLLSWVGQGKIELAEVEDIISGGVRGKLASPTAPPHALCLLKVFYPED